MKYNYDPATGKITYTIAYGEALALLAKRKQINDALANLHAIQAHMIEEAVEKSDMKEANELIAYIRSLPDSNLTKA
jgi:23S rRNA C2498 (ribose-2'-O)-methylase RlmM